MDWAEPYFSFHGLRISTADVRRGMLDSEVDPVEYSTARRLMTRQDRVLVAGNGMGSLATLLAAEFGRETVVAYEANPALVAMTRNWINFADGQLLIRQGALGAIDGPARLRLAERWAESSMYPHILSEQRYSGEWIEVMLMDTNRVVRQWGTNALVLDVEGAEHDIIPALDLRPIRWLVAEAHGTAEQAERLLGHLVRGGLTRADCKPNDNPCLWVISASRI